MNLDRNEIHDIKNQLAIGIGMLDLILRNIAKDGANIDIEKFKDRILKAQGAAKKIEAFFEENKDRP